MEGWEEMVDGMGWFEVEPIEGGWKEPGKWKADLWNAMPKPDCDVEVVMKPKGEGEWKFVWE